MTYPQGALCMYSAISLCLDQVGTEVSEGPLDLGHVKQMLLDADLQRLEPGRLRWWFPA